MGGARHYGELLGEQVQPLSDAPWLGGTAIGASVAATQVRSLCPVAPSKIIGIGRNYREHAKEMGSEAPKEPLMFLKAPSVLLDPGGEVILPAVSKRIDYEGELAVVIGRRARRVSVPEASSHVFGYAVACDVTARDLQHSDGQWTRAKGFDTFCPLSSAVTVLPDANDLSLTTTVNGEVRQAARTSSMVFSVAELVSYISSVMTLQPGDLILTGTPEGVGPMQPGDRVQIEIEHLGDVQFTARAESA
jgi:2-keto-4-pentenoate hydratase/2-oxohepta-3-ene-1,7-dioic acid hydratase in catechol pathway